jgi:hypothetical protein
MNPRTALLRRPSRPVLLSLLALLVLVLACGAWVALRAVMARSHLETAKAQTATLEDALRDDDAASAGRALVRIQRETAQARGLTHDPVWTLVGLVPVLGDTPDAVSTVAATVDDLAQTAFPSLVRVSRTLTPQRLRPSGDAFDLEVLAAAGPDVDRAARQVATARSTMDGVGGFLPGPVDGAVDDTRAQLRRLSSITSAAARAIRLLPPMLGSAGPRAYLVAVQNPAEARGTGGLLGGYGVMEVQDGRIRLRESAPNTQLVGAAELPVDLGRDFHELYGDNPALWSNANMSPNFSYAARIWLALWQRQFGERLDGVIASDPIALGYLVGATRPVELADGTSLTAQTTADFVMRDVYAKHQLNPTRDRTTTLLGRQIIANVLDSDVDPAALLRAVRRAAGEGRVLVYSAHAAEQRELASTRVAGALPRTPGSLAVVVNNGGGNKLDVYLRRDVRYTLGPCSQDSRPARLEVRLTNRTPSSTLPDPATGLPIRGSDGVVLPRGSNRPLVYVYAPSGARLRDARLDGQPQQMRLGAERGHPVFATTIDLRPGQSTTLVLRLTGVPRGSVPHIDEQPAASDQRSVIAGPECIR